MIDSRETRFLHQLESLSSSSTARTVNIYRLLFVKLGYLIFEIISKKIDVLSIVWNR